MPDWPTWVQAAAAIVQAGAAVVIVILTRRLAKANDALVKATDNYARSARDQVDELVAGRTAGVEPYVRIPSMRLEIFWKPSLVGGSDRSERNLIFHAPLANMGPGPAMDVRPWLELPTGIQVEYEGPSNLASGQESQAVIRVSPAHFEALVSRFPYTTSMRVWYRDLLDRQWLTSSDVVLGWIGPVNDGEVVAIMTPTAERRELVTDEPKAPRLVPKP